VVPLAQPVGEGGGCHRPTEQEALAEVAAESLQLGADRLGLDPLGHHLDAELVGEVDGGADDGPEARVAGDRAHQRHVQLELVDGPAAQALQRGEAGAEVVEGDPYAELGQLGEEADADRGGRGLLAHLQREHPAGHLLGAQELGDDGREPGIGHGVGVDVDRDRDDPAGRRPDPVLHQ
jgi:hypothetical protein